MARNQNPSPEILKRATENIEKVIQERRVLNYLIDPKIPEVLVNPDFLIVPSPGKLVSLDILFVPTQRSLWNFALENIESLIETKLATGISTVASVLLLYADEAPRFSDAITLLKHLFDHVIEVSITDPEYERKINRGISTLIDNPETNQRSRTLLELEGKLRPENFERLSNNTNVRRIFEQIANEEQEVRDHVQVISEDRILDRVKEATNAEIVQKQRVFNIKQFFIHSFDQYYFTFDFMVRPLSLSNIPSNDPLDVYWLEELFGSGGSLNNIVTIKENRSPNLQKLRRYATYARFTSYKFGFEWEQLEPLEQKPILNLIINGILKGPEHAPKRYVDMLLGAGWNLIKPEDITGDVVIKRGDR